VKEMVAGARVVLNCAGPYSAYNGEALLGECARQVGALARVRSHRRFRNRGTEYVSESGIEWMSGGTKRQCDRALVGEPASPRPPAGVDGRPARAGRALQ
jgi:hypothetical protein